MKKTRIITRHFIPNYGSFLQTVATVELFNKFGFDDVKVIDYISTKESIHQMALIGLRNKLYGKNIIKKVLYYIFKRLSEYKNRKKFRKYRKKYIPLTKKYDEYSISNIDDNMLFVAGSDQLWGKMPYGELDNNYYLSFVKKGVKIAFSSSFGSFKKINSDAVKENLKDFDLISVREKSTQIDLENIGINAFQVLDPTILIGKDFWDKKLIKIKKPDKYVLIYQIHNNSFVDEYKKYFKKLGYTIVRISLNASLKKEHEINYKNINPFSFIYLIKNADYVITDSFHGNVFSLIYEKQFINTINNETSARISDLLENLHLEDRLVNYFDEKIVEKRIDYSNVNNLFTTMKDASFNRISEELVKRIGDSYEK